MINSFEDGLDDFMRLAPAHEVLPGDNLPVL
jgi:hypothetical protein